MKTSLNACQDNQRGKVVAWIEKLQEKGAILPRPYADLLRDGIHELRIKVTGSQVRILYFFCFKNYIILTHVFNKSTKKVPEKEIKKAIKIPADFLTRFKSIKDIEVYYENI